MAAEAVSADANRLSNEEIVAGWILLFDGDTLFGWQNSGDANWQAKDGMISASSGAAGLLATTSEFADYSLRLDFRHPANTNSGVFLRTPLTPTDPAADCYELNIADPSVSPYSSGGLVNRAKAESRATSGAWHTYELTAVGGHIQVALDGQSVLDYSDPKPLPRGRIGLQFREGPIEFRNIKLKPLALRSIFNGRDLAGWKVLPDKKSVFSVIPDAAASSAPTTDPNAPASGVLNVKNGNGGLESDGQYGDFVLQIEILSNGKGLNSGIFFRSIPGEFWQGYECQVQNAYKNDDRAQPVDCGTGGFYRRQNARRIVADDFQWFSETLVVSGPHMAAWVNGYQVSDWTDDRKPDDNPRKGLRTAGGTLQIQGHDPTTDLSFRNIKIVELPKP